MGEGERHRGQTLRRRVDDHHGVLFPRLAGPLVADAAPEIDDLLAAVIGTAGAAQLPAPGEVLGERVAHRLEARADVPVDDIARRSSDKGHTHSFYGPLTATGGSKKYRGRPSLVSLRISMMARRSTALRAAYRGSALLPESTSHIRL